MCRTSPNLLLMWKITVTTSFIGPAQCSTVKVIKWELLGNMHIPKDSQIFAKFYFVSRLTSTIPIKAHGHRCQS